MDLKAPHLRYKDQTIRERTWTIHFIALEKILNGAVVIVVAMELLTFLNDDIHAWAVDFVDRHGIDAGNRFVHAGLEKLVGVHNPQLITWSALAVVYSALLFTEGLGLWFQKRWAEYLTAVGTGLLIPLELFEIYERVTWFRVGILILNIFIVWYLFTRLRDEKVLAGEFGQAAEDLT
jgi:uncharacterized membrane protein (DUF2068 family)